MNLLGSTKKDVDQDKDGEHVPKLESAEVVLVSLNLVNNNYQQPSKVSFTFVPNKQFIQLITIATSSLTMLNTTNKEFSFTEVWFTNQNSKQLEIEDDVNMTLTIGKILKKWDIQQNQNIENMVKVMVFCHLQENLAINMVKSLWILQ